MDNFRKPKAPRSSSSALDGFLSPGRNSAGKHQGRSPSRPSFSPTTPQNSLNNFRGVDGFRPNPQAQIKTGAQSSAWPARPSVEQILEPAPAARRGRRSRLKQEKKRRPLKTILKTFLVLFVVTILTGGFLVGRGYLKARNVFKGGGNAPALAANVDPTKLNGEGDGRVNVLLLGKGGDGHEAPDLTDTLIIASIDPVNKTASLLSIPRDLWVKSSVSGGQSKINAVYANAKYAALSGTKRDSAAKQQAEKAGLTAIENTIENTMGIPIHYYVMVDFVAFEKAINTVGGVDLNVSSTDAAGTVKETLWDELTGKNYTLDVRPGQNHFDGQRALMYSRSRHTSNRGDFDRTERQRKIMIALKDKILSAGTYSNPLKINQLINDFGDHVQSNFSTEEILRVYDLIKSIDSSKINSVGLADPPNNYVTTDNVNGQSIVRPRAGLFDYSEIQNYIRNSLKDGYLKNESANVAVYNGSGIGGYATTRANELKSFGYTITTIANAPTSNYSKTIIVDLTNGSKKYTKHYLEQRFGVTATGVMPDSTIPTTGADFVIILGKN